MANFEVIPAIDLIEGKCVRLEKGNYEKITTYNRDPVDVARQFCDFGLNRIHVIDLDGARAGNPMNLATVEKIAALGVSIEFGGGIRKEHHIQQLMDAGAKEIILGSTLIKCWDDIGNWLEKYPERLIASIDAVDGKVATHGWLNISKITDLELLRMVEELGFTRLIYTDIERDGMLSGLNMEKLTKIAASTSLNVVVAGGVSDMRDLTAIRDSGYQNIVGAITGKAIYEGRISLEELSQC